MADRLTGKASYITINGTVIPITKYTWSVDKKLADVTDSGNYNSTNDIISVAQIPATVTTKVDVEGRFRRSSTPSTIVANMFTGLAAVPVNLGLDAGTLAGHGNFDLSNFSCDVPVDDTVVFKCSLMSNGDFTPNA